LWHCVENLQLAKLKIFCGLNKGFKLNLGVVLEKILTGSQLEGRGSALVVVSEPDFVYIFQAKGARGKGVVLSALVLVSSMPPGRRDRKIPDPAVEREMRELCAMLDAMETTQRHTAGVGDINEAESENEAENEEVAVEYAAEECLFRVVARIGSRAKMGIPMYEGNLDVEELLD
jgi:hypothetical protein